MNIFTNSNLSPHSEPCPPVISPALEPSVESLVESLEMYLDGEMSPAQAEAFKQQSESDGIHKAGLARLMAERKLHQDFFSTLQLHDSAEDVVVSRLLAGVGRALDLDERRAAARGDRLRILRYVVAAAACVVFSFSAGWIGHGHSKLSLPLAGFSAPEVNASEASDASFGSGTFISNLVSSNGEKQPASPNLGNGGVTVILKDQLGRVVGIHRFASPEEARAFVQDIGRSQLHQQQLHPVDPQLPKDHF